MPTSRHEECIRPLTVIRLSEWTTLSPKNEPQLKGQAIPEGRARQLVDQLQGRVDIRPSFEGLEISSSSYVGRVDVGPLRILIEPKLDAMPLTRLLRYAYGLSDLEVHEETRANTGHGGIVDLLIALLCEEGTGLASRGLTRRYTARVEDLASPRGALLMKEVIRNGGVREPNLPCRHFERSADWHLNQLVRTGLEQAAHMTEDPTLRHRCMRLAHMLADVRPLKGLTVAEIDRAEHDLDRTTSAYAPMLGLIRLLHQAEGFTFEISETNRLPGFLFDMNAFFQRLLSRFLREHATGVRIADEVQIRELFCYAPGGNPQNLRPPRPRPDYALYEGKTLRRFLDAKYRDIWERRLPSKWLYQLSLYAMASPEPTSLLLYPTMNAAAKDALLQVRWPVPGVGADARVVTRPVDLLYLSGLLDPNRKEVATTQREALAARLIRI
ncbi:conserved hypothetical protein [Burkholderiales bacterium 8X]|nr:conserved hypothetical protein [Burkholderiales bacterium 8X]